LPLPTTTPGPGAAEVLQGYRFTPDHLGVAQRAPGISAFMRIRNGEEFLEATVRSHIDCFDEVVALYNQCTDRTEQILLRLQQDYPHKLRVIHYVDRVFPPGSEGHAATPADSPNSLVNYYNAALAATRFSIATKLDDDHLAIADATRAVTDRLRREADRVDAMHCFSGLNLIRGPRGDLGILASTPISGGGDIGFFPVRPETYFVHDRRFERFRRGGLKRRFDGFLYWHLKYLKAALGFANYEIDSNPDSRYARRLKALADNTEAMVPLRALPARLQPGALARLEALLSAKKRLKLERDAAVATTFPDASALAALQRTTDARWLAMVLK
jgi:Beta-1,4-N-acetylgalactosaminyltransferase (CgtA)